jgi:hypothetical protein
MTDIDNAYHINEDGTVPCTNCGAEILVSLRSSPSHTVWSHAHNGNFECYGGNVDGYVACPEPPNDDPSEWTTPMSVEFTEAKSDDPVRVRVVVRLLSEGVLFGDYHPMDEVEFSDVQEALEGIMGSSAAGYVTVPQGRNKVIVPKDRIDYVTLETETKHWSDY